MSSIVSRGFDSEETRGEFVKSLNGILNLELSEENSKKEQNGKCPLLCLASEEAKSVLNENLNVYRQDKELVEKKQEAKLLQKASFVGSEGMLQGVEKERNLMKSARMGVVQLLNEVVQHKREKKELEKKREEEDPYAILESNQFDYRYPDQVHVI